MSRELDIIETGASTRQYPADDLLMHQAANRTRWDDLTFPLIGNRLDVTRGHIDYNYTDVTLDFDDVCDYPDDPVCFVAQMKHQKKFGSDLHPHIHWLQSSGDMPNWMIRYRWCDNGFAPTSWVNKAWDNNVFTYSLGDLVQITEFPAISPTANEDVSSTLQIILFRDTSNDSTLFSATDPLTGDAQSIEFDLHYEIDSLGSYTEYSKERT